MKKAEIVVILFTIILILGIVAWRYQDSILGPQEVVMVHAPTPPPKKMEDNTIPILKAELIEAQKLNDEHNEEIRQQNEEKRLARQRRLQKQREEELNESQ